MVNDSLAHLGSQDKILRRHKDPIRKHLDMLNYLEKIPPMTVHPIMDIEKWKNRHQTVIVVFVKDNPPSEYINRSSKLCTSLNLTETMKCDVVSLSDGVFYYGLVYTGKNPGGIPEDKIREQARKWGYNQCVIVSYCGVQGGMS